MPADLSQPFLKNNLSSHNARWTSNSCYEQKV